MQVLEVAGLLIYFLKVQNFAVAHAENFISAPRSKHSILSTGAVALCTQEEKKCLYKNLVSSVDSTMKLHN